MALLRFPGQKLLHEAGVKVAAAEVGVGEDLLMHGDRRLNALHDELRQRSLHLGNRLGAVVAVDDQLGDQRIVVGRDNAFGILRRIHAHTVAAGNVEGGDLAG